MRIKRGTRKKQRHNKVLDLAKGYRMTYSKLFRRAKEAVAHAGSYEFAHRRHRPAQIKEEWIKTISAELSKYNYSYSKFIDLLKKASISIDRKNLAELIIYAPEQFRTVVESVESK